MDTPPPSGFEQRLFGPGPKRVLSLDGGGVRGLLTIAILERIEAVISAEAGRPVRLCEVFDLIGGTSTGALIATALALGQPVAAIRDMYLRLAPAVFRRSRWRIPGFHAKFDARPLRREIEAIVGERTLDSPDLRCGLCVLVKRLDTGSPWVLATNPRSRYWSTPADRSFIGNRHLRIADIVRASTAAPHFFDPEPVRLVEDGPPGLFVDGGLTPHKNPALQLLLLAALDGHGLRWPIGPENLMMISVGTGEFRHRLDPLAGAGMPAIGLAVRAMSGLIADTSTSTLALLHWLSGTPAHWPLNGEIGTMADDRPPYGRPLLAFERYDARLDAPWLEAELGLVVPEARLEQARRLDEPAAAELLHEIGRRAAERFVRPETLRALMPDFVRSTGGETDRRTPGTPAARDAG